MLCYCISLNVGMTSKDMDIQLYIYNAILAHFKTKYLYFELAGKIYYALIRIILFLKSETVIECIINRYFVLL